MTQPACSITPARPTGWLAQMAKATARSSRSVIRTATAGLFKRSLRGSLDADRLRRIHARTDCPSSGRCATRAGGTSMSTTYDSVADLAAALRRAADAHGHHEEEIG